MSKTWIYTLFDGLTVLYIFLFIYLSIYIYVGAFYTFFKGFDKRLYVISHIFSTVSDHTAAEIAEGIFF